MKLDTIGILCAPGGHESLRRALPPLLQRLGEPAAVLVFALPDVHLAEGEAQGVRVTARGSDSGRWPLPTVVYHIAVQRRREDIRKMRAFAELPGIRTLNPSNEISQRAVRRMLLASPSLRPLVPPLAPPAGGADTPGFLLRPEAGMRVSRLICARRRADGWDFCDGGGVPVGHEADAEDAAWFTGPGRYLKLVLPREAFSSGGPAGARGIVQRGADGEWQVVESRPLFGPPGRLPAPPPETEPVLREIARRAGLFLPDLALCTVDVLHIPGRGPLFLGLGGWQPGLLGRHMPAPVKTSLCRNMLGYSRLILRK